MSALTEARMAQRDARVSRLYLSMAQTDADRVRWQEISAECYRRARVLLGIEAPQVRP